MRYAWTDRQFVGGTVALDLVNTVCYRDDPARRFDKITDAETLTAFARASLALSDAGGWQVAVPGPGTDAIGLAFHLGLREAVDRLFRPVIDTGAPESEAFASLLRTHADLLGGESLGVGPAGIELDPESRPRFALVVTFSAIRLAGSPELKRLKRCPSCHWLFVDRSRNASRVWCDMLTCGNRAKAARHQGRHGLDVAG